MVRFGGERHGRALRRGGGSLREGDGGAEPMDPRSSEAYLEALLEVIVWN